MKRTCVLALLIAVACGPKDSVIDVSKIIKEKYEIKVVDERTAGSLSLDSLLEIKSIVKMETTSDPNSLLVDFSKVIIVDSTMIVLDGTFSGLKVFDKKGRFIKLIGSIGQGPGEYIGLNDFEVKHDTIRALTKNQQLIEYDLHGNYLDTKRIDMFAWNFASTKSGYVFFRNYNVESKDGASFNLITTDRKFNILSSGAPFFERAEDVPTFGYTGFLSSENDEIMFSEAFSSYVCTFEGDSLYRKYIIDFGANKKPDDLTLAEIHTKGLDPAHLDTRIFEIKDLVFFKYFIAPRLSLGIFDKKSKIFYPSSKFNTESYLSSILSTPNARIDSNTFIVILPLDLILYLQKDEKYMKLVKEQNQELYTIVSGYTSNDNPLVITFSILE